MLLMHDHNTIMASHGDVHVPAWLAKATIINLVSDNNKWHATTFHLLGLRIPL